LTSVFFYISGHGFGHASRQIEIINALGTASRSTNIVVRTSAPAWLFERTRRVPLTLIHGACDTGGVQLDSLRLDERGTIQAAAEFYRTFPERCEAEAALLRAHHAALVVSDAPPLACAAAAAADLPSVVISNFTWDWIYEHYAEHLAEAPELLPAIRDAYAEARAGWRLPMHGGFATVQDVIDVPFVARHARHARSHVREVLGLPRNATLVLSSFGGYGVSGFDPGSLDCLDEYGVVFTERTERAERDRASGLFVVTEDALYAAGLRYEDLVSAVDVVATKPGYGIVSECIANRTAVLYTSRGRFAEYEVLVREMPRFLRCAYLDQESLLAGRWRETLDRLASSPAPPEQPPTNGAEMIAAMIRDAPSN
jgi:hypothetical protein